MRAWERINLDTCLSYGRRKTDPDDGRPDITRDHDERNYDTFVAAVNRVNGAFHGLAQYREWAELNVTANFQEGSRKPATRHTSGSSNSWPSKYNHLSSLEKNQRWYSTEGARHFMNLRDREEADHHGAHLT